MDVLELDISKDLLLSHPNFSIILEQLGVLEYVTADNKLAAGADVLKYKNSSKFMASMPESKVDSDSILARGPYEFGYDSTNLKLQILFLLRRSILCYYRVI